MPATRWSSAAVSRWTREKRRTLGDYNAMPEPRVKSVCGIYVRLRTALSGIRCRFRYIIGVDRPFELERRARRIPAI